MSDFNAYHRWLGIPISEQPANLYRLLGLSLFEPDAEVIKDAAERQISHVRKYAQGKYREQANQLLNELSRAQVVLLDKKTKRQYDRALPIPEQSPMQFSGLAASPIASQTSNSLATPQPVPVRREFKKAPPKKKSAWSPLLIGALTALILSLALCGFLLGRASRAASNHNAAVTAKENNARELNLAIQQWTTAKDDLKSAQRRRANTSAELKEAIQKLASANEQRELAIENGNRASAKTKNELTALVKLKKEWDAKSALAKQSREKPVAKSPPNPLTFKSGKGVGAFSSDGTRIISREDSGQVTLWDAKTTKKIGDDFGELMRSSGRYGRDAKVAVSPDGMRIICHDDNSNITLWDVSSGNKVKTLVTDNEEAIRCVAFSTDGEIIASGNSDGKIQIWDAKSGTELRNFKKSKNRYIEFVAFQPNSPKLLSTSAGVHKLWNTRTGQEYLTLEEIDDPEFAVFSPDGEQLVLIGENDNKDEARLFSLERGRVLRNLGDSTHAAFSPDGERLASYKNGDVYLINTHGKCRNIEKFPCLPIQDSNWRDGYFAFSADSSRIVVAGVNKASVYDAKTGEQLSEVQLDKLGESAKANKPAGGGADFGNLPGRLTDKEDSVLFAFSPDASRFAAYRGNTIKIFNAVSGVEIDTQQSRDAIKSMTFSPDGTKLLYTSWRSLKLWTFKTNRP